MSQTIKLTKRSVYGNELVYPACPLSEMLVKLTGHKTFSPKALELLQGAGYSIQWTEKPHE